MAFFDVEARLTTLAFIIVGHTLQALYILHVKQSAVDIALDLITNAPADEETHCRIASERRRNGGERGRQREREGERERGTVKDRDRQRERKRERCNHTETRPNRRQGLYRLKICRGTAEDGAGESSRRGIINDDHGRVYEHVSCQSWPSWRTR